MAVPLAATAATVASGSTVASPAVSPASGSTVVANASLQQRG